MPLIFERRFVAPIDEPGEVPLWLGPFILASTILFLLVAGCLTIG